MFKKSYEKSYEVSKIRPQLLKLRRDGLNE